MTRAAAAAINESGETRDDAAARAAAGRRYRLLPSPARQRIAWAADEMMRQVDWDVWSLLTSSPVRGQLLRDCTFTAFLAWEQKTKL
ncbi:MAG: hypothetical protein M3Y28_04695 [Armatimonadota bacterium]|nr:hypothetical protein [Armatimonadota bacterium]